MGGAEHVGHAMAPALPVFPCGASRNRKVERRHAASRSPSGSEILVLLPTDLTDGLVAIEAVRSGRSVLLNASHLEPRLGQRLLDITCGGISAMDGQALKVGDAVYLFTGALSRIEADSLDFPAAQAASSSSWAKRL